MRHKCSFQSQSAVSKEGRRPRRPWSCCPLPVQDAGGLVEWSRAEGGVSEGGRPRPCSWPWEPSGRCQVEGHACSRVLPPRPARAASSSPSALVSECVCACVPGMATMLCGCPGPTRTAAAAGLPESRGQGPCGGRCFWCRGLLWRRVTRGVRWPGRKASVPPECGQPDCSPHLCSSALAPPAWLPLGLALPPCDPLKRAHLMRPVPGLWLLRQGLVWCPLWQSLWRSTLQSPGRGSQEHMGVHACVCVCT